MIAVADGAGSLLVGNPHVKARGAQANMGLCANGEVTCEGNNMIFISKHDWHLGRIILFGLLKHVKWNLGSARAYVHLFVLQMVHELFGLI